MIDNWISEPMKKTGSIWSCILKDIFLQFLGIFLDFFCKFSIFKPFLNKK